MREYYERRQEVAANIPGRNPTEEWIDFVRGIHSTELRDSILREAPETLDKAFEIGQRREWAMGLGSTLGTQQPERGFRPYSKAFRERTRPQARTGPATVAALSTPAQQDPEKCWTCGGARHRLRECPEVVCNACNTKGHIAKECPGAAAPRSASQQKKKNGANGDKAPAMAKGGPAPAPLPAPAQPSTVKKAIP